MKNSILQEIMNMKTLDIPEFKTYEEEAEYWDTLDTALCMEEERFRHS